MIRGRLKRAQFLLTLAVFSLPLAAFTFAAYLRFATHLLPHYSTDADPSAYFGLLLLTTILWAIVAEHYELTSIEKHLLVDTKAHQVLLACLTTYVAVLSVTFFYRETSFSRIFMWLSGLGLFCLALLLQIAMRWFWRKNRSSDKASVHLLIVGADEFAVQ